MSAYGRFTVLEGGKKDRPKKINEQDPRVFADAYVSNTRFMGVVGIHVHWMILGDAVNPPRNEHHLFYVDTEEGRIENFSLIPGSDRGELAYVEAAMMNGLGGEKVPLDRREAAVLVCHYMDVSKEKKLEIPLGEDELRLYREAGKEAGPREIEEVLAKQYCEINSPAEAINYFLMRYFVRDMEAAKRLMDPKLELHAYRGSVGTMSKNNIERVGKSSIYNCETLLDCDNAYNHVVSRIHLTGANKVDSFSVTSKMKISSAEAAMILARPEYVTVYRFVADPEEHEQAFLSLSNGNEGMEHDTGFLFVRFFPHNRHVNKMNFVLSDDVAGVCYVTDYGELILGSYSKEGIEAMENQLLDTSLGFWSMPTGRYEFREPLLYDFIHSGFTSFEEFLKAVRS